MIWPFSRKVAKPETQSLPRILYFKSGEAFFEMQCKYGLTAIERGTACVGLVVDAYGLVPPVKTRDDGIQVTTLKIAREDGGFVTLATTFAPGSPLAVGDVVLWVPYEFVPGRDDKDKGWVGFIRAKIAPEINTETAEFKIIGRYDS